MQPGRRSVFHFDALGIKSCKSRTLPGFCINQHLDFLTITLVFGLQILPQKHLLGNSSSNTWAPEFLFTLFSPAKTCLIHVKIVIFKSKIIFMFPFYSVGLKSRRK